MTVTCTKTGMNWNGGKNNLLCFLALYVKVIFRIRDTQIIGVGTYWKQEGAQEVAVINPS